MGGISPFGQKRPGPEAVEQTALSAEAVFVNKTTAVLKAALAKSKLGDSEWRDALRLDGPGATSAPPQAGPVGLHL